MNEELKDRLEENLQDLIDAIAESLPKELRKSPEWQAFKYLLKDFQDENIKIINEFVER